MLQHAFLHAGLPLSVAKPSFFGFYFDEKPASFESSTRTSHHANLASRVVQTRIARSPAEGIDYFRGAYVSFPSGGFQSHL